MTKKEMKALSEILRIAGYTVGTHEYLDETVKEKKSVDAINRKECEAWQICRDMLLKYTSKGGL